MTVYQKALRKSSPLALAAATLSLASCALPPREAWQRIKEDGLITFVSENILHTSEPSAPVSRDVPVAPPVPGSAASSAVVARNNAPVTSETMPGPEAPVRTSETPLNLTRTSDQRPVVAKSVPSLPGFVRSPYTNPPRLVDAKGATAGSTMICPYTQQAFILPSDFISSPSSVASSGPIYDRVTEPTPAPAPSVIPHPSAPPTVAVKNDVPPQTPAGSLFSTTTPTQPAPAPKSNSTAPVPAKTAIAHDLPYGSPISGRPGFVNSPFAAKHQLVDVTGLPPGMEVKCPYTGKPFRVPSQDIAVQNAEPAANVAAPESTQKK